MASWDITLSDLNEPILIEVNMAFGQLDFHQITNGPIFGDLTDKIFEDVFSAKFNKITNKLLL